MITALLTLLTLNNHRPRHPRPTPTPTPISAVKICPESIHNQFVTIGPDGKTYPTWHPVTVGDCSFDHDHGDDPATSNIYDNHPVAFGYIASQMMPPMIEHHAGFKCHVVNSGTKNDEGTTALNDSYFCFHMGTASPGRFTQQFHSEYLAIKTPDNNIMRLQVMADTGNVGTICSNPREGRTVLGLGCPVDSPYEIWQNTITIKNGQQQIATAVTSTAVFDPITVMDPQNPSSLILSSSPQADPVFKFTTNRSGFRDCNREEYHGPFYWNNQDGTTQYKTDAMGNVYPNGTLTQEISNINSTLVMGYKSGNLSDPQSQFKMHQNVCSKK